MGMAGNSRGATQLKRKLDKMIDDLKGKRASSNADFIGKAIVKEMKALIATGKSPITGKSFPAYKNPKRYPGKLKSARPVNLRLTGRFLAALAHKVLEGTGRPIIRIYLTTRSAHLKERGHREGAGGQPLRPIIPEGNELLAPSIFTSVRKLLRQKFDIRKR